MIVKNKVLNSFKKNGGMVCRTMEAIISSMYLDAKTPACLEVEQAGVPTNRIIELSRDRKIEKSKGDGSGYWSSYEPN